MKIFIMPNCAVTGCNNYNQRTKGTNIKYYRFPKNEDMEDEWILACGREDRINLEIATICSVHFEQKYFEIPLRQRLLNYTPKTARHLKADAIPTLHLPGDTSDTALKQKSDERSLELSEKSHKKLVDDIMKSSYVTAKSENDDMITVELKPLFASSTDDRLFTQPGTEQNLINTSFSIDQTELNELREKVKILKSKKIELLRQIEEAKISTVRRYDTALKRLFTPGQIKKLLNPDKSTRIHWSREDIASAITLRSVSSKAYKYLIAHNYPLPPMSTLRKWARNFDAMKKDSIQYS